MTLPASPLPLTAPITGQVSFDQMNVSGLPAGELAVAVTGTVAPYPKSLPDTARLTLGLALSASFIVTAMWRVRPAATTNIRSAGEV